MKYSKLAITGVLLPFAPLTAASDQKQDDNTKPNSPFGRQLFDSGEHQAGGEAVILTGLRTADDTSFTGTDEILPSLGNTNMFTFGNLTYISGDVIGPHRDSSVICHATNYADRKEAAMDLARLFDDDDLTATGRLKRASQGANKERVDAAEENEIFQKHVAVHSASFSEFDKIDDTGTFTFAGCGLGYSKNAPCMLKINYDHFGDCAKKTYQVFHDLALEKAAKGQPENLKEAYFYEGLGSHALTDLFSAGHLRTPSKRLRTSHCSAYRGGIATNQMHDEDSYNGLLMTNRHNPSHSWWVFGDSFYFEPFNKDNREMMHTALQESINEVYAAYEEKNIGSGASLGKMYEFPGKGIDYVPDLELSKSHVKDFWDVNTCPLWYEHEDGSMYRRFPWYRLRSQKGRELEVQAPAADKFGLFEKTFPLVDDENQLGVDGEPDLKMGDCWFKFSPETTFVSDECSVFGVTNWDNKDMFYSPEAAGFMPPTYSTCQAYTKGGEGRRDFDSDCYDVLELVSKGQNCADLVKYDQCIRLSPRCSWKDSWGPDIISGGTCVQGNCVAYSKEAGDIVEGDPTPPVPAPPSGFYMSFQGACAFNSLDVKHYKLMPGKHSAEKCGKLCIDYTGSEGSCTGIAVDFGPFQECYLYFKDACQKADSPGFDRCPSHGLQTFHRGSKKIADIMGDCACSQNWYYKDPEIIYNGCASVQEESWGSWCYVAEPDKCELGMYSTTQPDQKWRYCDESTCENFLCPNGFVKRDSVICYDDSCGVLDCCISIDLSLSCSDMSSKSSCENIGCEWLDGWFSDSCAESTICEDSQTAEECKNKGCAWQDGYIWDSCEEGTCDNWYNKGECEHWDCEWVDSWVSDYCKDPSRRLEIDEINLNNVLDNWESVINTMSTDTSFISTLAAQYDIASSSLSESLQSKLNVMLEMLKLFEDSVILFAAFDDGRFYSLKSCSEGPTCWSKYPNAEYTFGIVEPESSEFLSIFKVVSGKVNTDDNYVTEFGVPDFASEEYNVAEKVWYDAPGWTQSFTCTLLHPEESNICQAYSVEGENYVVGIQIQYLEIVEARTEGGAGGKKSKNGKKTKKAKKSKKSKNGKKKHGKKKGGEKMGKKNGKKKGKKNNEKRSRKKG